ncbi:possible DNA polymerase family B [Prochlorococcus marinus str. MIT 9313]|uniref:Possible DNA polymerase family B n=1 Tax=Prochlorococcus marinus (strain MIT 9313) TaxID=74547 RepID=Q7V4L4_PROMM|nr:possible DNA polymerase family B [Prochlorococcus marinus str. MIT 9313]
MHTLNGKPAVNQTCRHENIQAEANQIFEAFNLPSNPKIPKAKKQFCREQRHDRDVLNSEQAASMRFILNAKSSCLAIINERSMPAN